MPIHRLKVDENGKYKNFYGYTVVSFLNSEKYSFVEDYIKNSRFLSKYFSALPASSYHMTVFNLWCCNAPLLPIHKKWIDEKKMLIEENSGSYEPVVGFTYRENFFQMMLEISEHSKMIPNFPVEIRLFKSLNSITASVDIHSDHLIGLRNLREKISPLITHGDENLVPHITFAYKYREIEKYDIENVKKEMLELEKLIESDKAVILKTPTPCMFSSMEYYITLKDLILV